ncbi:MAG: DedA family protein [Kiritimatiellae bacterium]|nr:DedA family protein [Kiritimatiellia bacterium]
MTEEAFLQLCEHLSTHLWLQSLLVVAGTCFLEDAGRCAVALLVAAGQIGWWLALASMTAGGMAGDIGRYLIGRYGTSFLVSLRWVDRTRLEWMEEYFRNHAAKTVLASRFLPGARTLAFCAAGVIRYPFPRYLALLFIAALVQALIFLKLGAFIGDRILPYLRDPLNRTVIVIGLILTGVLMHLAVAWIKRRHVKKCSP